MPRDHDLLAPLDTIEQSREASLRVIGANRSIHSIDLDRSADRFNDHAAPRILHNISPRNPPSCTKQDRQNRRVAQDSTPKTRVLHNSRPPKPSSCTTFAGVFPPTPSPRYTPPVSDRPLTPIRTEEDAAEASLRPQRLSEFIGQKASRENLAIFIEAARTRNEALDHVLLHGPPGLGKTTLAQIVARELGVGFRATSGPVIQRAGDLAAILTNLQPRDVLFIDEIHRLQPAIEEVLYPAMEDFQLDLIIGEGPSARSVRIDLPHFTLVGATTRAGLLATPLRDRFGIPLRLIFYTPEELELIVRRGAEKLNMDLTSDGAAEIARRSRGTPRIAGRLLRRVRDFAAVAKTPRIDKTTADAALNRLEVDARGLDAMDRRYLLRIAEHHAGGPVGVETLAAALAEARDTLEDVIEPFLIQEGLVLRTSRGRMLGEPGWRHLNLAPPPRQPDQLDLLRDEA